MSKLSQTQQEAVCKRVLDLLNSEINPKELAKHIRLGSYDLTINALSDKCSSPPNYLSDVIISMHMLSEALDPVMEDL